MSTPMFEQFHALKAANPDAVLFFRMGDFYETFFEDAEVTARVLDLTLTARNKQDPNPVPMAGVPHHAAENYIARLIAKGHKVALCEQIGRDGIYSKADIEPFGSDGLGRAVHAGVVYQHIEFGVLLGHRISERFDIGHS